MYTEWLFEQIDKRWHDREFMICNGDIKTYSLLKKEILYWREYLQQNLITAGQIAGLEGDYSPSIIALFFALMWNRNIIVPTTNIPPEEIEKRNKIANVMVRFVFEKGRLKSKENLEGKIRNELLKEYTNSNEPGLILFSSGSTGVPKAILHDLTALTERFCDFKKKSFKSLIFLLFDHIGGINTLFSIVSGGGSLVVAESRRPEDVLNHIEKYKVELLPTSPTFLNLILISEAYENYDLSSLKLITYGTEPMPKNLLKRLKGVFRSADFKQTYGITELGILGTKSKSSESLWMKIGGSGYQVKIVDDILWVKSKTSMIGYLNAPSPFTEDGWFITGDKVEIDGEYFKIIGRDTDIINVGGKKVFPCEVEDVLLQMNNVRDVVVYGEKNPITGQIVAADVNLFKDEPLTNLKRRLYQFCRDRLERYKVPVKIKITNESFHGDRFKKMRNK